MNILCRIGLHSWTRIFGTRHWHVECRRCERREVWLNESPGAGLHPIDHTWGKIIGGAA